MLTHVKDSDKPVNLILTVPAQALAAPAAGDVAAARSAGLTSEGYESQLAALLGMLQPADPNFEIVLP